MESNRDIYDELFLLFKEYKEPEWYKLITNILEFRTLDLPVTIDSGLPEDTLIFVDTFLRKRSKCFADFFTKQLIDYYTTFSHLEHNIKNYFIINWVISKIKPTRDRYALENKFTREDFLNEHSMQTGEDLQLGLLSTLSSLRFVSEETITDYLFNRQDKYKSDDFILVSLRYCQKTTDFNSYKKYLNHLINCRLTKDNCHYFIDAFKELVFLKKSYKFIYLWILNIQDIAPDKFSILKDELRKWINYSNKHVIENYNYCDLIIFELNKDSYMPCYTIKRLLKDLNLEGVSFENVIQYLQFDTFRLEDISSTHIFKNFRPYRIYENYQELVLDPNRIAPDKAKTLCDHYKIDVDQLLYASLTSSETELLYSIMTPFNHQHIA